MVMKTLGFRPLRPMQTHHFLFRQDKLQLAPDQAALTVNGQQLVKGNEIFVTFAGDFYPGVEQNDFVVRMLCQALAQRSCFQFHVQPDPRRE